MQVSRAIAWIGILSILLSCSLASCRRGSGASRPGTASPPDVSRCTRLEIRCEPSVFDAVVTGYYGSSLLNAEETRYLRSLEMATVVDRGQIRTFARRISAARYEKTSPWGGTFVIRPVFHLTAYRGDRKVTTFLLQGPWIEDESRRLFKHNGLPGFELMMSETRSFSQRMQCAERIGDLKVDMDGYAATRKQTIEPAQWCDMIRESRNSSQFKCPGAREGRCHYAMNPACEPDSPPDTVLLFETKAGWNQHGGPELFTFDNHDPRGGLVLLNDGTVKFIRTEEELKQLRWE